MITGDLAAWLSCDRARGPFFVAVFIGASAMTIIEAAQCVP
jgi:hypothetical protein